MKIHFIVSALFPLLAFSGCLNSGVDVCKIVTEKVERLNLAPAERVLSCTQSKIHEKNESFMNFKVRTLHYNLTIETEYSTDVCDSKANLACAIARGFQADSKTHEELQCLPKETGACGYPDKVIKKKKGDKNKYFYVSTYSKENDNDFRHQQTKRIEKPLTEKNFNEE